MFDGEEYMCVCLGCIGLFLIWWLLQTLAIIKVLEGSGPLGVIRNFLWNVNRLCIYFIFRHTNATEVLPLSALQTLRCCERLYIWEELLTIFVPSILEMGRGAVGGGAEVYNHSPLGFLQQLQFSSEAEKAVRNVVWSYLLCCSCCQAQNFLLRDKHWNLKVWTLSKTLHKEDLPLDLLFYI